MEVSGLFLYLVFLAVILVSQYLKRRKNEAQRRQSGRAAQFPGPADSPDSYEFPDLFRLPEPLPQPLPESLPEPLPKKEPKQAAKPARVSAYRALTELQEAPTHWNTQKAASKKSMYRAQFKDSASIQQAVVSMVVLGPCRSDEPYRHK
jgi:hypothetical protein